MRWWVWKHKWKERETGTPKPQIYSRTPLPSLYKEQEHPADRPRIMLHQFAYMMTAA